MVSVAGSRSKSILARRALKQLVVFTLCLTVLNRVAGAISRMTVKSGKGATTTATLGSRGSGTLVFDVGLNNGADTALFLSQGYQVVGVEANPLLVEKSKQKFSSELDAGRFAVEHVALPLMSIEDVPEVKYGFPTATNSSEEVPTFYINRLNDEFSSFAFGVGCRGPCWQDCQNGTQKPGENKGPNCCADLEYCTAHRVPTVDCDQLYKKYGVPYILKLDIEGGELSCILALQNRPERPRIVTVEINQLPADIFGVMHPLGYTQYKVVPQLMRHNSDLAHSSGPIGDYAEDCDFGYNWRTITKAGISLDCKKNNRLWKDLHFRHPGPTLAGLGPGTLKL